MEETVPAATTRFDFVDRSLLRQCIHCGLCLPTCPTYKLLGTEHDSPRGRIYQMLAMADGRIAPDNPHLQEHIGLCLGCRACETACPSGVHYGRLLEAARAEMPAPSRAESTVRKAILGGLFTSNIALDVAGQATRFYQRSGLQRLVRASGVLRLAPGLESVERLAPDTQGGFWKSSVARFTAASGERRLRVALLTGCVQAQFFGETNRATVRVLAANGCDVVVPEQQACCGALHVHSGDMTTARGLAKRNIEAFEASGADYYVVNGAGCGSTLKEYGTLLSVDSAWAERASVFSTKMLDITELLASVGLRPPTGEFRHRVAYHDACHLAHGQRVRAQPRSVLAQVPGLTLVPLADSEMCCGSAGTYNITHSDEASRILEWKVDAIEASGAEVVAAGNPGCIIQIQLGVRRRGLRVEVMHPVDILDRAYRAGGAEKQTGS